MELVKFDRQGWRLGNLEAACIGHHDLIESIIDYESVGNPFSQGDRNNHAERSGTMTDVWCAWVPESILEMCGLT